MRHAYNLIAFHDELLVGGALRSAMSGVLDRNRIATR